jgi:hypothetical protein
LAYIINMLTIKCLCYFMQLFCGLYYKCP